MFSTSSNRDGCLLEADSSVQEDADSQTVAAQKLAQYRTHLSRRLMRGNPEKSLSSKPDVNI